MSAWKVALSAVAFGAVLGSAMPAGAQTKEELDRARHEFQEGVALAAANNCAAAIGKFRSVLQVKATAQVSFNIAECEERMGRLAAAIGDYRVAAKTAEGDPKAKDVYAKCSDKVTALEERVPKLTVKRGNGADNATIELDGVELGAAQFGTEIPVDPGPHTVIGKIGDKVYFRENVTLAEKETKPIDVVMKVVDTPVTVDETPPKKEEPPPEKPRSRVPGIAIASAGAVSVGVGIVFFAIRGGAISDLDGLCGAGQTSCPDTQAAHDAASKGKTFTGLAEVTIGLGTVALVTGIVLAATAGPKAKPTPASDAPAALFSPSKHFTFVADAPGASIGGGSLVGRF